MCLFFFRILQVSICWEQQLVMLGTKTYVQLNVATALCQQLQKLNSCVIELLATKAHNMYLS